jgi:hypothetical protein
MYYSISLYTKHYHAVNVLFKKDDPLKLDNNRPISVLNVDLKLLNIKSHSKESKAFEKSKKIIAPSILINV